MSCSTESCQLLGYPKLTVAKVLLMFCEHAVVQQEQLLMFVEAFSAGELNNEAALPEIQIEWKRSFFVIYCFDNYLLIFCFSSLLIQSCPRSDAKPDVT